MPTFRVLVTVAALGLAWASPAVAQVDDRAWEECKKNPEPDWVVFNCTAVIEGAGDQSKSRRARALVLRSAAFVRKKEPDKARSDLTRAVSLAPDNPEILTARADFLFSQSELEGAAEDYKLAIEVEPRHARAHFGLAGIARQRGDIQGAVAGLDKVLSIDPRYPRARALRIDWSKAAAGS